jgi:hypothetical protein
MTPRQTERRSHMTLTGGRRDIFLTSQCKRQHFLPSLRYRHVNTKLSDRTLFLYRITVIFRWSFFLCKLHTFGTSLNYFSKVAYEYTPFFRLFVLITLLFQVWCYMVNPRLKDISAYVPHWKSFAPRPKILIKPGAQIHNYDAEGDCELENN